MRYRRRDFVDLSPEMRFVSGPDGLDSTGFAEHEHHRNRCRQTHLKTRARRDLACGARPLEILIRADGRGGVAKRAEFDGRAGFRFIELEKNAAWDLSGAAGFDTFGAFHHLGLPLDPVLANPRLSVGDAFDQSGELCADHIENRSRIV